MLTAMCDSHLSQHTTPSDPPSSLSARPCVGAQTTLLSCNLHVIFLDLRRRATLPLHHLRFRLLLLLLRRAHGRQLAGRADRYRTAVRLVDIRSARVLGMPSVVGAARTASAGSCPSCSRFAVAVVPAAAPLVLLVTHISSTWISTWRTRIWTPSSLR